VGQEELFYGYPRDDQPTSPEHSRYLLEFLRMARDQGKRVLVIDYCRSPEAVADSYRRNAFEGFLSFAAPRRELDVVPSGPHPLPGVRDGPALNLAEAGSFLYLINPGSFPDASAFLGAIARTRYDLLVVDPFVDDEQRGPRWLSAGEVDRLQRKSSGAPRLVLAYLSIGEAESYRYYWHRQWDRLGDGVPDGSAPSWLERGNPHWPGNYKVRYWDPGWRAILFGNPGAYLDGIIERGFDGMYLDLVDAYLYFEEKMPTPSD
jgi:cysteinyl-tRNA synthetase